MSEISPDPKIATFVEEFATQLAYFATHLPFRDTDDVTVILKGQLLIEEQVKVYVNSRLEHPAKIKRFSFDHFLRLAEAMNSIRSFNWMFDAARQLNGLRNKISHNLVPNELDEGIRQYVDFVKNNGAGIVDPSIFDFKRPDFRMAIFALYGVFQILNKTIGPPRCFYPWPDLKALVESKKRVFDSEALPTNSPSP